MLHIYSEYHRHQRTTTTTLFNNIHRSFIICHGIIVPESSLSSDLAPLRDVEMFDRPSKQSMFLEKL